MVTFIASADWQLGMTARYLPDDSRARYQQARFDAIERLGQLAEETDAAFVVVGGDVFEHNQVDSEVYLKAFEALLSCPVPVLLVPGNHDPLDAASIYDSPQFLSRLPQHVTVVRNSEPHLVCPGVEVVGVPWPSKAPSSDLVAEALTTLAPPPVDTVRVLVGHGAVSSLNPDRDSEVTIDLPTVQQALQDGLIHFAVFGDRHSALEVAERVWYPGTPEVTHRREVKPGTGLVVHLDASRAEVEERRVGRWQFLTVEANLDTADDVAAFIARLEQLPAKSTTALWLALTGTLTTQQYAELEMALERLEQLFARIDLWQRHTDLVVVARDRDFSELELTGYAQDALDELVETAQSDTAEGRTAQAALALLYRLAKV